VSQNALQAGSAAAAASARKTTNYALCHSRFFPVAVETLGPLSDEAYSLIAEIGRRATLCFPAPTYFRGNSAFQCSVPCQHTFTVSASPS